MGTHISVGFAVLFLLMSEITQLCLCGNSNIGCIEGERQALLKFKASFNHPSYGVLPTWEGNDCCQWKGIGCNNVTGHVISLNLSNPCSQSEYMIEEYYPYFNDSAFDCWSRFVLVAQDVDPSILQLKHLSYLDLSGNFFNYSPIPMFLGSMTQLTYISLYQSGFSGRIPHSLGNLTNLRHLDLGSNFIYADEISWISQLSSLQHLDLSDVEFGKAHNLFQVLNLLPSLLQLRLRYCELASSSFPHPPIILTNLTRIEVLDLSYNNLDSLSFWLDKFNNLVELYFQGNRFDGQFSSALQNLTSIRVLDLSANNLSSVPPWLVNFKNLVHLDLSFCQFNGPIPNVLRSMTSLKFLDLSWNNLFSVIPSWLGELKSLVQLNLHNNELKGIEGSLSSILRNMCCLKVLDFSENKLQGEALGAYELSGCTKYNLQVLDLWSNELNDSLPTWLGQLENLRYLDLQSNLFFGSIPLSLGKLSSLRYLLLNHNNLNGTIPHSIGQCVNLTSLDLSDNNLDGVFPDSLGQLVNLKYLGLANNSLDGLLPDSIQQFANLQYLLLSNNNFNGVIPQSLGQLVNLSFLDLSNNYFVGVIPQSLGQLVNLSFLDLSNNYFVGVIPPSLGQLVNLHSLNLSRNNLHGSIPTSFGQLVNLSDLDLSSNSLQGAFSEIKGWSELMYLWRLNIADNQIIGPLPDHIGDVLPMLGYLLMRNNHINGSIPNSLCKIEFMSSLDLSNNKLSGEIPDCWRNNTNGLEEINFYVLEEINLSSNNLSGLIPSSFGNLFSLSWLHLNKNNLQGEIPFSLKNLKELVILDLGENQLSGIIPPWTGDMFPSLQILRLRQNMLNGSIPSQLCQLSVLQILDLADNNFVGSIPRCIGNLRVMHLEKSSDEVHIALAPIAMAPTAEGPVPAWNYNEDVKQVMKGRELEYTRNLKLVVNMDLSENKLVGLIPKEIISLTALHGLNLSHNHLRGEIPRNIGNMKSLESFDVSYNQLSNKIPNSMSTLTSLSHLNLSYNDFSGPIPTANQFLTLDDPYIYVGNPLLCGASLPKKCAGDGSHQVPRSKGYKNDDGNKNDSEKVWFYFVIAVGYAIGFWGVIGVLLIKKSWRHACFRWVDDAVDELYVAIFIKVARLKRKMMGNNVHE